MNLFDLLRSDGSIVVNKALAHTIGLNEAIIYSELVSLNEYWKGRDQLTNDGWFYCTVENLEKNTTLKQKTQQRAIKKLKELGLIEVKMLGIPAKRHFYITDKIYELVLSKPQYNQGGQKGLTRIDRASSTRLDKLGQQGEPNNPINNTTFKNTKEIIKDNKYNKDDILHYNWLEE